MWNNDTFWDAENIQWSGVIARSILSRWYIRHCNDSSRIWIRFETDNKHPIGWGVCCEDIGEYGPRYNGTALFLRSTYAAVNCVIVDSAGGWVVPKPMQIYPQLDPQQHIAMTIYSKSAHVRSRIWIWICRLPNVNCVVLDISIHHLCTHT